MSLPDVRMLHNKGWFQPGYDPRRHVLTHAERRQGGRASLKALWTTHPRKARWIQENLVKAPINRAQRNASILAWAAARRRQEPDDIPF